MTECNTGYYGNASSVCIMCSGNRVKMEAGDAPSSDTECDTETMEPNDAHTECGKKKSYFEPWNPKIVMLCFLLM